MLLLVVQICLSQDKSRAKADLITLATVDSIEALKKKIQLGNKDFNLKIRLAEIYLQNEKLDKAEEVYESLIGIDSLEVKILTGLGTVLFYRTPSKIIPFERLKELLKIDFRSKAIKKFKQALSIAPDYLPARYYLALSYMRKTDEENLKHAEKEFNFILLRDQDYRDLTYQLGFLYQKMGNYDKSLTYFDKISEKMKDYARARIRMSEVYYELNNYALSTDCYYQAMASLVDKDMLDYLFDEQKILLTDEEKNEFKLAAYDEKKEIFKKFWKRRDPDPSTPENERLMEHFRRVKFARNNFHFTAPPYYDDRGKIYIKYGAPDLRYNSPLGSIQAKDNESWSYENIIEGLVFDFVADGGYFRIAQDLTDAAPSGYSYGQRLAVAAALYQERNHISDSYSRLSVGFSMDRLNDFHAVQSEALIKHPGEFYTINEKRFRFPFISKWAQFRDENQKTRVEFYTSFPGSALQLKALSPNSTKYVDFFIEVDDTNFNMIQSDEKRFSYEIISKERVQSSQYMLQNNYSLSPGKYSVALVLTDVEASVKGVQRRHLDVMDFASTDELMLSSLQLSSNIEPHTENKKEAFTKNGLRIVPYTFTRVMRSKPIYVYFEIYNLKLDNQRLSNFDVTYSVETTKPKRNFWQKTFGRIFSGKKKNVITTSAKRVGDSRASFEYLAFDLKNMDNGETDLRIKITDLISKQSVEAAIEIILID